MPPFARRAWSRLALIWRIMGERQLGLVAAGVGFFAMLAVFPALAALIALVGFWADPQVVQDTLALTREFLPDEAFAILSEQTARLVDVTSRNLGWASALSLLAAAWSARRGVGALAQGVNAIYGGTQRGGLGDIAVALALTSVLIGVGAVSIAAILITPLVFAVLTPVLPPGSPLPLLAEWTRWAVSGATLMLGLSLFYRYGPNRAGGRRSPFLSPGLALAMVVWMAASIGFSLFLANFGNYNEVYGSLGAAVALLMWFYISAYAVLLGAAINYALERDDPQASADTPNYAQDGK
jgi:membrane protein